MPRKQFLLRIDPRLYEELERWAQAELRSVNGQIEYLLRQAVQSRRGERQPREAGPSQGPPGEDGGGS